MVPVPADMTAKDWLDWVVAVGLVGLAIDRWVKGREKAEDRQTHDSSNLRSDLALIRLDIQRVEKESREGRKEIETDIERLHQKASDAGDEMTRKGGELSIRVAVIEERLKSLGHQMGELWKINDRRN